MKIIDNKWVKGVISMPSNLFATTGTSVSIIFIDKSRTNEEVLLVDASDLGMKVKDGKNQRTILTNDDIEKIQSCFLNYEELDNFSILVNISEIKEKDYSLSATQYFDIKIEYLDLTKEEFHDTINKYVNELSNLFDEKIKLETDLKKNLEYMNYE